MACPLEIREIFQGKRLITRKSKGLKNHCIQTKVLHPMIQKKKHSFLSKTIDANEVNNARTYGFRWVHVLPACQKYRTLFPTSIVFKRPLARNHLFHHNQPKMVVYVDQNHPHCISFPAKSPLTSLISFQKKVQNIDSPACRPKDISFLFEKKDNIVIQIRKGSYKITEHFILGRGWVVTNYNNENVGFSNAVSLSSGQFKTKWKQVLSTPQGNVFAMAWNEQKHSQGSKGLFVPLWLQQKKIRSSIHFSDDTKSIDTRDTSFLAWDANQKGATYLFANPHHPLSRKTPLVLAQKTKQPRCVKDQKVVPCSQCKSKKRFQNNNIQYRDSENCYLVNHSFVYQQALKLCQKFLGNQVQKCLLLKLPEGQNPNEQKVSSSHTDTGILVGGKAFYQDFKSPPHVLIRGIHFVNMPLVAYGSKAHRNEKIFSLDGNQFHQSYLLLMKYGGFSVENNYFEKSNIHLYGEKGHLNNVILRNNFIQRGYVKPITLVDQYPQSDSLPLFPSSLHKLKPRCQGSYCNSSFSLYPGKENFISWKNWNKMTMNVIQNSAAFNTTSLFGWIVAYNHFQKGDHQEGILDVSGEKGVRHVLVHHNWVQDSLGTGILIKGGPIEDLLITDNQFYDTPGQIQYGAGSDRIQEFCDRLNHNGKCDGGSPWSIYLVPSWKGRSVPCQKVTLENNLIYNSYNGGMLIQSCEDLVIRFNTIYRTKRDPVTRFIPFVWMGSSIPTSKALLEGNIFSSFQEDPRSQGFASLQRSRNQHLNRNPSFRWNYFRHCSLPSSLCKWGKTSIKWNSSFPAQQEPLFVNPVQHNFRLFRVPRKIQNLCSSPQIRPYRRPGFNYLEEKCPNN